MQLFDHYVKEDGQPETKVKSRLKSSPACR